MLVFRIHARTGVRVSSMNTLARSIVHVQLVIPDERVISVSIIEFRSPP